MNPNGETVADLVVVLRNLQNQAGLFRAEKLPLKTVLAELVSEYDKTN